jgi:hypothetical protein
MATSLFVGGAPTVAQVNTETPANVEDTDEFYIRLENHASENYEIGFTATAATVQNVVEGLVAAAVAAAAAGTAPWNEVTCTEDDTKVTITADVAGVPFYVTTRTVDGGGADTQTLTDANTTACAGPSIFSTPENWDSGSFFADNDTVVIRSDVAAAIYGGDYTANKVNVLIVEEGFDQAVGSWAHPLQLDMTGKATKRVEWWGTGDSYVDIDDVAKWYVYDCGGAADTGLSDLNVLGEDCTAFYFMPENTSALCALAGREGELFEVDSIYQTNGILTIGVGTSAIAGPGNGIVDLFITGGECECAARVVTATNWGNGGTFTYTCVSGIITLNAWSGTNNYSASSGATSVYVGSGATLDLSGEKTAITITNAFMYADSTLRDPDGRVTWTNGIDLVGCNAEDVTLQTKVGATLTPS